MIILFLLFQTCFACKTCITGPINLEPIFINLDQLYIQADSIIVNNSTRLKYFDVPASNKLCSIRVRNMTNTLSLRIMSSIVQRFDIKYKKFNAKQGFSIIYNGIGDQKCESNIFQITLLTDGKSNFLVANYITSKWNYSFNFEVAKNKFITDHSSLLYDSNVDDKGKWVFPILTNNSTKLKVFHFLNTLLILFYFK